MCFRGIHQGQRNVSWVISLGLLIATNMAATQPDDRIFVMQLPQFVPKALTSDTPCNTGGVHT